MFLLKRPMMMKLVKQWHYYAKIDHMWKATNLRVNWLKVNDSNGGQFTKPFCVPSKKTMFHCVLQKICILFSPTMHAPIFAENHLLFHAYNWFKKGPIRQAFESENFINLGMCKLTSIYWWNSFLGFSSPLLPWY